MLRRHAISERQVLESPSQSDVKECVDRVSECTIRTMDYDKFKQGRDVRLRTFKTRAKYYLSTAKLRRRSLHKMRTNQYFDSVAERFLKEVRRLSGDKHVSIVVGDPTFGTLTGWKCGGYPWRQMVASIDKVMRRRIQLKSEKWSFVKVNEKWTTKQYVSRYISHSLDQS